MRAFIKKHKGEFIIFAVISVFSAILFPNFFKGQDKIVIPTISDFLIWFLITFILIAGMYFSFKQKEKVAQIPDGHQKLYNEQGQMTKEGVFEGGKLINGSQHVYKKDGTFSHTETFINGIKTKNA